MKIIRKLFCYAFLIGLTSLAISTCFAQPALIKNFQLISAADTVTHEVEFITAFVPQTYYNPQTVYIQVDSTNTGTIKFCVALTNSFRPITPAAQFKSYGAGARIPVTIRNGIYNLFYKASASGNKFSITN